jgi:NADH dehydrogenase/NADH:ubiquinone oxidoreductase subunit G
MCDAGRWGYHFHNSEDNRLLEPRLRRQRGENLSASTFKEIQLVLEEASSKSTHPWEFWVSDEASHEEIEWSRELKKSWTARGRKVSESANPSDFSAKVLRTLSGRLIKGDAFEFKTIKHFVSVCLDYRALEDEVALLALKAGQKVRNEGAKWSQRNLSDFAHASDDLSTTLYLVPVPQTEEDLQAIEKLPRDAHIVVLWKRANSRGLLEEGIAPLEALEAHLKNQTPKGPVFVFGQSTQLQKSEAFANYLKAAPFVVLVDSFLTSWSEFANVVLPVEALYESHCHLTNLLGIKQNSKGVQIRHANLTQLSRGSESPINPSLKLI